MLDLNAQPDGLRIPDEMLGGVVGPELEEYIRDLIWMQLVRGNDCLNDHAFEIACAVEDEGDGTLSDEQCRAIAQYLIDARSTQQAGFGDVPPTKLDRAFEALRRAHVVAEQGFSCCNNCGFHEIHEVAAGPQWAGFVFFHMQDAERLVETGETYLSYGMFWRHYKTREEFDAMSGTEKDAYYKEQTLDLMRRVVVPVLRGHGMEVDWDGDLRTRVLVRGAELYRAIS